MGCRVAGGLPRVREGDPADESEQTPAGHAQPADGARLVPAVRQGLQVKVQHGRPSQICPQYL